MNGDYTKVPLRGEERWTGARMQQGRVLVDHDWNLNLDATARGLQDTARDVIGPAGVVSGSSAFQVGVTGRPARDLVLQPGRLWVDGMAAFCPAPVRYSEQDQAPPLPASGQALAYLDVFAEHVHPAEAPDELLDPALAPLDSTARTRVGWRVHVAPTTERSVAAALAGLGLVGASSGRLTITRVVAGAPADPCDPPGDPLGLLPDGPAH